MRLDKYLCESTELSRAEAKRLLRGGDVTCNGKAIKTGNFKVPEGAEIKLEGRLLSLRGLRYIMLNKPLDYISSTTDGDHPSVLNLLDVDKASSLHIAGRLDVDTTGLLLITDDGQWSHKVTSPKKVCGKRYQVQLADPINEEAAEALVRGVELRSEKTLTKPAQLEILSPTVVLLTITEGKYHQVKRMFAATGNKVVNLHREQIGDIELDDQLQPGEWRYLTDAEMRSVG